MTEPHVEMRHVNFGGSLKQFLTALAADITPESNMIVVPLGGPIGAELATTSEGQPVFILTFYANAEPEQKLVSDGN